MAELSNLSIHALYEAAASAPTPGGGAVTALSAMLGVSLILKALRVSLAKRDDAADHAAHDVAFEDLAAKLEADADADSAAFQGWLDAARLPRTDDAETTIRVAAMRNAAAAAAESAIATLLHARAAIALAGLVRPLIAANLTADIVAGVKLLEVAIDIAHENLEANLPLIKDEAKVAALRARI